MYCGKCGEKIMPNDEFCPKCGHKVPGAKEAITEETPSNGAKTASIILGIISLVGVFFIILAPVSLILAIIGLILGIKANKEVNNTAGIVLNSVGGFISLIITTIVCLLIYFVNIGWDSISNIINDVWENSAYIKNEVTDA